MRRAAFLMAESAPYEAMLEFSELLGLPVAYNPRCNRIAKARGFWPLKSIEVGDSWFELDYDERMAVLLHEAGHALKWDAEVRLLLIPIFWTKFAVRIVHRQELAADAFAVSNGYGVQLLRFLSRFRNVDPGEHHPNYFVRARNIHRLLKESR